MSIFKHHCRELQMKDLIITLGGYEQIILNAQIYISYEELLYDPSIYYVEVAKTFYSKVVHFS